MQCYETSREQNESGNEKKDVGNGSSARLKERVVEAKVAAGRYCTAGAQDLGASFGPN